MNKREKAAKAKLNEYGVHTDKYGGVDAVDEWGASSSGLTRKTTSLRNLTDSVKLFRKGR